MLDATTCKAGHYVSQTDAAPLYQYFNKQGNLITVCEDYHANNS